MVGIYKIVNIVNNKIYIGQSSDIYVRWTHHKTDLRNNLHHNYHLQNSWNKYGESSFEFSIVEECTVEELDSKEILWINYYDSKSNGYNLDSGGCGVRGYKHTEEELYKMRKSHNPLPVMQFDKDFNFIKLWIGGSCHAAKSLGLSKDAIVSRCSHKSKKLSNLIYKDSYWVYEDEYISDDFSWNNYMHNISSFVIPSRSNYIKKKIIQYTKDFQFVKEWDSFSEIENAGFIRNQVNMICNHKNNKKTHRGFIWAYADYDFSDGYFDSITNPINKATEKKKVAVIQYDLNGTYINTYSSIHEASVCSKSSRSGICNCLSGKNKTCNGFIWKRST